MRFSTVRAPKDFSPSSALQCPAHKCDRATKFSAPKHLCSQTQGKEQCLEQAFQPAAIKVPAIPAAPKVTTTGVLEEKRRRGKGAEQMLSLRVAVIDEKL